MSKGTQLWPGDKMRAFYRAHIRRETSLDDPAADKLAEALTRATNRMLVLEMPAEPPPRTAASTPPVAAAPAKGKGGKGQAGHGAAQLPAAAPATSAPPAPPAAPAFDPYAFSAMVVLAKTGRDGLLKRLADIKSVEHLRALAEAQHLAVDAGIKKADDLRKAIVAGTEQRLADRKAAAS